MTKSASAQAAHHEEEQRGRPGYDDFHAVPISKKDRTNSYASSVSTAVSGTSSTNSRASTFSLVKPSPTVNVHTTCGRHTDQLLFGGPSLSEMARSIFRKKQ